MNEFTIFISGVVRFRNDIRVMLGPTGCCCFPWNICFPWWMICWSFLTPLGVLVSVHNHAEFQAGRIHVTWTPDTRFIFTRTHSHVLICMFWLTHTCIYMCVYIYVCVCIYIYILPLIASFMGPTWGPHGTDRTQVGLMLAPWTLLSGTF